MSTKPVIAVLAGSGAMGGTQKAAAIFAAGLARRGYSMYFLCHEPGLWSRYAAEGGVHVVSSAMTSHDIGNFLASVRTDVIHQHVSGMAFDSPVDAVLAAIPPGPRPVLIETNVFGRFEDPDGDRLVWRRMFMSRASGIQAFQRARLQITAENLRHTTVLPSPMFPVTPVPASERLALRAELGLSAGELLAVRVGRPADCKWADWECRAFAAARGRDPRLRLLLMEPPSGLHARITAERFGAGIQVRHATDDQAWLNRLYAAADLTVHASFFGESFGYTIAEAMAAGLPVITMTTPFGDNAQVELVENGVTGWVCGGVAEMARRWVDLAADQALRVKMGIAGRARIAALTDPERGLDILEAVIAEALTGAPQPLLASVQEDLLDFAADFPAREWRLSEPAYVHPASLAFAHIYARYRNQRSRVRRWLDKARIVLPMRAVAAPAVLTIRPEPVRIAVLADGQIGGMQKAAARFAVALAADGCHVEYLSHSLGPWTDYCAQHGLIVRLTHSNGDQIYSALCDAAPHVIHQHVSGYTPESIHYLALERLYRRRAFRVIESNVFGQFNDAQSDRWVDFRMFKSMTSLITAHQRAGRPLTRDTLAKMSVLCNPVIIPAQIADEARQAVRRELGLGEDDVLVIRVGRPVDCKWADWECRALQISRRHDPRLRLLLMEPPDGLKKLIQEGRYGDGIILRSLSSDFDWMNRLYQSADLMLHGSFFGESFGYTVAEGMAAGLPVITRTTPYCDNAQTELVENGTTGWVCLGIPEMARRLLDLARDPVARRCMGDAGRARIESLAAAEIGVSVLRAVVENVITGRRAPILDARREAILAYAGDLARRQCWTSEAPGLHPLDTALGRAYTAYRTLRAQVRLSLQQVRRDTRRRAHVQP